MARHSPIVYAEREVVFPTLRTSVAVCARLYLGGTISVILRRNDLIGDFWQRGDNQRKTVEPFFN